MSRQRRAFLLDLLFTLIEKFEQEHYEIEAPEAQPRLVSI
jgi:hypothetical protein